MHCLHWHFTKWACNIWHIIYLETNGKIKKPTFLRKIFSNYIMYVWFWCLPNDVIYVCTSTCNNAWRESPYVHVQRYTTGTLIDINQYVAAIIILVFQLSHFNHITANKQIWFDFANSKLLKWLKPLWCGHIKS